MEHWSRKHDRCANCGTTRRRHRAKGYCSLCYALHRQLSQVRAWDFAKPETLVKYPRESMFWRRDVFDQLKAGYIEQIEERLGQLRVREAMLDGPIEGIDLEFQLERIAALAGLRGRAIYNNLANHIHEAFRPGQRLEIYRLLSRIEENLPWIGVDYGRIWDPSRRRR